MREDGGGWELWGERIVLKFQMINNNAKLKNILLRDFFLMCSIKHNCQNFGEYK